MAVIYNNKTLTPAPQVSLNTEKLRTEDGRLIGVKTTATLTGQLVAENPSGTHISVSSDARLSKILSQQTALQAIFADDGKFFEIQGWDGAVTKKFNATVRSIEFGEGPWTDVCPYTIILDGTNIAGDVATPGISESSESWSFEEGDQPGLYKVTHSVSAKALTIYDANGNIPTPSWQLAKTFVTSQLGLNTTSTSQFSPKSGQELLSITEAHPSNTTFYNRVVSDTIDEITGSYSATETFTLSSDPYWEEFNVSSQINSDQSNTSAVVAVTGTIHGLYVGQGGWAIAYSNASLRWQTVKSLLRARAVEYSGVTLNNRPTKADVTHDQKGGTVSYTFEFSNQIIHSDTTDIFQVSAKASAESSSSEVTVSGVITGLLYPDTDTDISIRYVRALARWQSIRGLLLKRAVDGSGVGDLKAYPISAQVDMDETAGTITYSYAFDNRDPTNVKDEFSVSSKFDKTENMTTITVEGTITGIRTANQTDPFLFNKDDRYNSAKAYFLSKEPNLLGIAALHISTDNVNATPQTTSVSHNPFAGTVSYQYEFVTRKPPCTPDALSELITITKDSSVPIVAKHIIPGRGEKGPIRQQINTVTEKRMQLNIELKMPIPANICGSVSGPDVDISRYVPNGDDVNKESDSETWVPSTGSYSRTVVWSYN